MNHYDGYLKAQKLRTTFAIALNRNGSPKEPISEQECVRWLQSNAELLERDSILFQTRVVPDGRTWVMLGEIHHSTTQKRKCQFCGEQFAASYEREVLCSNCRVHWLGERHHVWKADNKFRLEKQYPRKSYNITKKEQLTLF
ncbi:hypothetical protein [Mangrovibacterium marinum]|nr:hypothetical protein [Mangrovibacterium marinum]